MKSRNRHIGILLVALSGICYGLIPTFAKTAYNAGTSTNTLLFFRFSGGAMFLLLLMAIKKVPLPSKKEALSYLLLGAFGYFGQSFCYFTALKYTTSSVVALLFYTYPAMVMLGSAILFKEKITSLQFVSLILALGGAFLIVGSAFESDKIGILLSLICAVFYSVYILVSSRIVKPGMGMQSSAFIVLGVAIVYGILAMAEGFTPPRQSDGYIGIALLAIVSTAFAFWTFLEGLEKIGASDAALVSVTEPVVVVLASVLILAEPITLKIVIGGCLVLSALITTSLQPK